MAYFDKAMAHLLNGDVSNYNGYTGEPPVNEAEYNALISDNKHLELGTSEEAMGMFKDSSTAPSWADVQAEMNVADVRYNRTEQYPSIEDQLDMQYHDAVNGTTTWKDVIAKVKSDNPK